MDLPHLSSVADIEPRAQVQAFPVAPVYVGCTGIRSQMHPTVQDTHFVACELHWFQADESRIHGLMHKRMLLAWGSGLIRPELSTGPPGCSVVYPLIVSFILTRRR